MQDVEHNMLNLHVDQHLSLLEVHAPASYLQGTMTTDAELNRKFPFGIDLNKQKQNIQNKKILPDLIRLRTKAEKPDTQFSQYT